MLILLNQEVIDVGDPLETLQALGVGDLTRQKSLAKLIALGQDAAFANGGVEHADPGIRRTLAALFGLTGQANCALFLCPQGMRSARDVAARLGQAPITTMALLLNAQDAGKLSAALINNHVWQVAPGEAAA